MKEGSLKRRKGFSMVELLTVVAIISVMAVIIGTALGGGNETISLGTGQRVASGMFQSARSIAILKQTETRVLIYGDQVSDTDPRKFLRFMGIVYNDPENPGNWLPAVQGTYLPEGVFFIPPTAPEELKDRTTGSTSYEKSKFNNGATNPMSVPFPVTTGTAENFYWYGFDANGNSQNAGGTFVLNAGRVLSDAPEIGIENPYATSGLAIRRIGGVILMNDYEEIQEANK